MTGKPSPPQSPPAPYSERAGERVGLVKNKEGSSGPGVVPEGGMDAGGKSHGETGGENSAKDNGMVERGELEKSAKPEKEEAVKETVKEAVEEAVKEPAKEAVKEPKPGNAARPAKSIKKLKTMRPGALPPLPKKFRPKMTSSDRLQSQEEGESPFVLPMLPKEEKKGSESGSELKAENVRSRAGSREGKKAKQDKKAEQDKKAKQYKDKEIKTNKEIEKENKDPSFSDLSLPTAWRGPVPPSQQIPDEIFTSGSRSSDLKRDGSSTGGKKNLSGDEDGANKARIGDYTLVSCLGSGGMAVIYESVQRSLNRTVALKVLRPEVARERQFVQRFEREARTLAGLQHENIIQVYSHHMERRFQYFVMEYVEGVDLFDVMERCGPLPSEIAAVIALQTARALEHAHYRGIIHRDIKPANLMLSYAGSVKLMDFGIARVPESEELTQHGTGLGTPSYMSPEQVVGDSLDGRTDIFSLGSVLYQMLTGEKPFIADEKETVLQKIRLQSTPSAKKFRPDLPRSLERIQQRCMQKRKDDRYWPTRELVRALERFISNRGIESENALLVNFFREKEFIDEKAAGEHLDLARRSGYKSELPVRLRYPSFKSFVIGGVALGAVLLMLIGVLLGRYVFSDARSVSRGGVTAAEDGDPSENTAESGAGENSKRGGVRVNVRPWAHVHIGPKKVATTPIADVLSLPPGHHEVKLSNPYCRDKIVDVVLRQGEVRTISEELVCDEKGDKSAAKEDDN